MPTPEQWDEIEAIVREDCAIAGRYIDSKGRTCAIGALALASGVDVGHLKERLFNNINQLMRDYADQWGEFASRFGLSPDQAQAIQNANDDVHDEWADRGPTLHVSHQTERRAAVLAAIAQMRAEA